MPSYPIADGVRVAFLARHGRAHGLTPSEVPFRANIWALKSIGVEYFISVSACGSLKEEVKPLDIVFIDQMIDRTKARPSTFFGEGIVAHVAFAEPVCSKLRQILVEASKTPGVLSEDVVVHNGGTYICIEGPSFSTKAESHMYRSEAFNGTLIGMTALPEAKLAREAEMAYCMIALSTDYDCWHSDHDSVTVEMVMSNLQKNSANAQKIVKEAIRRIAAEWPASDAHSSLRFAIMTPAHNITEKHRTNLKPIIGRYHPEGAQAGASSASH